MQLNELDENGLFFKEKARWIKYEEDVQPSGNWGRPFLPYIDAECLRTFKQSLENGKLHFFTSTIAPSVKNIFKLRGTQNIFRRPIHLDTTPCSILINKFLKSRPR